LIVLGLNGFEVVIEHLVIANLFFKFLDVAFFPLAESSLEIKYCQQLSRVT
jgi:hypothetical protein